MQEFADFSAYIKKMEDCGAHKFGIAKVISQFHYPFVLCIIISYFSRIRFSKNRRIACLFGSGYVA